MPKKETNAHSLAETAQSFVRAARTLYDKDGQMYRETFPAFYFLAGFALELGMKSLLSAWGLDDRALWKIGHNLEEAMVALAELSVLDRLHPRTHDVLRQLQDHHLELNFRYMPKQGSFSAPPPVLTLEVLEHLMREVSWRLRTVPDS